LTQAVTTVDFRAVPVVNISGRITDNTNGLSDITVQAVGALTVGTTTDRGGYYTLINVAAGTNTVFATNSAYDFEPERTTLDAQGDVAGVDFTGILVYAVSGRITSGGLSLSNVTVVIGARSGLSDSNGNYTVSRLRDNTYEVRPMLAGYAFAPTNVTVTVGPSTNNVNFAASGVLTISGRVLEGSGGVSNILITARTNAGAVLTDASGNYALSNLTPRTFLLSAQQVGVGFSPSNITVILGGTNASGINFTANPVRLGIAPVTNAMRITGLGLPQRNYRLQFATNGIASDEWLPLTTRNASTNGMFEFIDTSISNSPIKFYRSLPQ
jgi:hypothetical protein